MPLGRKIRYGMVGGGPGAFIGDVHRKAAALDGQIELVAGAFSSDPEKSRQQGAELFLDSSRVYGSYAEMADKEAALPEGERIDFTLRSWNPTGQECAGWERCLGSPLRAAVLEDLVRLVNVR